MLLLPLLLKKAEREQRIYFYFFLQNGPRLDDAQSAYKRYICSKVH